MITLLHNNYNNNKLLLAENMRIYKPITVNQIIKRTMLSNINILSKRLFNQSVQAPITRPYAAIAGKSKLPKTILNEYPKEEFKANINQHTQYITDFNIVYENPQDIKLYQIGTLFSKPTKHSHNVSKEQNYSLENKTQQIKFLETPVVVMHEVHFFKDSIKYFDNPMIKQNIENTNEYKVLFNQVLAELKSKNIKFRVANNNEDLPHTGFHMLNQLYQTKPKNLLLDTLSIKTAINE